MSSVWGSVSGSGPMPSRARKSREVDGVALEFVLQFQATDRGAERDAGVSRLGGLERRAMIQASQSRLGPNFLDLPRPLLAHQSSQDGFVDLLRDVPIDEVHEIGAKHLPRDLGLGLDGERSSARQAPRNEFSGRRADHRRKSQARRIVRDGQSGDDVGEGVESLVAVPEIGFGPVQNFEPI